MRLQYKTLDDKKYWITLENYTAKPFKKVASDFQLSWKKFFIRNFPKDFWAEEFLVKPVFGHNYRLDLFNFTKKFAVECHGDQHVKVSDHFHGGSQEKFFESLIKDREKELWCEHNGIELITVYTSTPFDLEFLIKKYQNIKWK